MFFRKECQECAGHKTTQSSAIAMRYGTGVPPSVYKGDMDRLFAASEWGLE